MKRQTRERKKGFAWEDLESDVLVSIFQRLDLKDLIIGAPLCCSSWYKASKDLSLWRNVDLRLPLKHGGKLISSTKLIAFVVTRSRGSLMSLQFPVSATMKDLRYVADRCPGLKHFYLRFPFYKTITNRERVSKIIFSKWKELESMDVNDDFINEEPTLQLINRSCPNFTKLKILDNLSEKTASLLCTALPNLKTIDLSNMRTLHREVVLIILKGCNELENLDLSGCGRIHVDDEILEIGFRRLKEFKWDDEVGYELDDHCSECECSDSSPCRHVIARHYSDYIFGTEEMLAKKYEDIDERIEEHVLEYDQFIDPPYQDHVNEEWYNPWALRLWL